MNIVETIEMKAAQIKYYRKCIDILNQAVDETKVEIFQGRQCDGTGGILYYPEINLTEVLTEPHAKGVLINAW